MYSTAADVLASLLLDFNKVTVESSIFIIEFENLIARYFWLLVTFFCSPMLKLK